MVPRLANEGRPGREMAVVLVAVGLLFTACSQPAASAAPDPSASSAPAPVGPASPDVQARPASPSPSIGPLPSGLAADIANAIQKRREYGLRTDLDWVLEVAADPRAGDAFGFPMLPEEEQFLWDRQEWLHTFLPAIQRYAAEAKDAFGGLYLDQANGRIVTLWTSDVDRHLTELVERAGAGAPIAAFEVRWPEGTLRRVQDQISADWDWFGDIDAAPEGVGADIRANVVSVDISSANPDAPRLIVEHYVATLGIPAEMLRVTSDGTGVALMPIGWVKGTVVLADGSKPGANGLMVDGRRAAPGHCGGGDIGYGVREDGGFEIPCTIGAWTIVIEASDPAGEGWVIVGQGQAVVHADETVTIRIRLVAGADIEG